MNKYNVNMLDSEVVGAVGTSASMTGSRCYDRAMELAECYLEGYAVHFDD